MHIVRVSTAVGILDNTSAPREDSYVALSAPLSCGAAHNTFLIIMGCEEAATYDIPGRLFT